MKRVTSWLAPMLASAFVTASGCQVEPERAASSDGPSQDGANLDAGSPTIGDGAAGPADGDVRALPRPEEGTPCVDAVGASATTKPDATAQATVTSTPSVCSRTYTLTTTQSLRDDMPRTRRVDEPMDGPWLRTGNTLLDALYAMTHDEIRENSVDTVRDYAFRNGEPVPCGTGGCFETGRKWNYVWTRDTSYAVDLGLAVTSPRRSENSLAFKLSGRRGEVSGTGGTSGVEIVQDTGSGGSWPVSTDRVVWALGVRRLLAASTASDRTRLATLARDALRNTVERDRLVAFDGRRGLYGGETSFLDWREQTYPRWTSTNSVPLAESNALSTNVLHDEALRLLADLEAESGDTVRAARYRAWSDDLRRRIHEVFGAVRPLWASTTGPAFDGAPVARADALGLSLAILSDIATKNEGRAMLSAYPLGPHGPPVVTPQDADVPVYHNRSIWPFVTAYVLRAARHVEHDALAAASFASIVDLAGANLSNMENVEYGSGLPWVDEGAMSGPVVNSQRQLWSVAAFVTAVHEGVFGLEIDGDGVRVRPRITHGMRRERFGGVESIALSGLRVAGTRVSVRLRFPGPTPGSEGTYRAAKVTLACAGANGQGESRDVGTGPVRLDGLGAWARFDVELVSDGPTSTTTVNRVDPTDRAATFAPPPPDTVGVGREGDAVRITVAPAGSASTTRRILRDGDVVATIGGDAASWLDTSPSPNPCYAVESVVGTRVSHRTKPACAWSPGSVTIFGADALVARGGRLSDGHGRRHHEEWGDADHTLTLPSFRATRSGLHKFQTTFGNGGPVSTGVTCAVKRLRVLRVSDGSLVSTGYLVMPHLGSWSTWAESSTVEVRLEAGVEYGVVIDQDGAAENMSHREHFATYTAGVGGTAGPFQHVNVAELRVLATGASDGGGRDDAVGKSRAFPPLLRTLPMLNPRP